MFSQIGAEDDGREHASNHAAAVVKNVKQALIVAMDLMQDHLADEFTRLNSAHLKIEKSLQSENAELRQRLGALNTECVDLARRANYWKVQNETLQANMNDMITRHNETLALLESKEQELKVLRSSVASLEEEKVVIAKLPLVEQSALADNNKRKAFELEGQLKKVSISPYEQRCRLTIMVFDLPCYLSSCAKLEITHQSSIERTRTRTYLHLRRPLFEVRLSLPRIGSSKAK